MTTELKDRVVIDQRGWTSPVAVPPVAWLATQIVTGYTSRIVDAAEFGTTWP